MKSGLAMAGAALVGLFQLTWSAPVEAANFWETTFNCNDWDQTKGLGEAQVCLAADGIRGHGGWTSTAGNVDRITAAANNPTGGGGKGFRHVRGDGTNNGGGGIGVNLPSPLREMWLRFYMRYPVGFSF